MTKTPTPESVLFAALIAEGPLSAVAQRAALAHAKARGPGGVLQPLAAALVHAGLRDKKLPPRAGMRTAEIVAVVEDAAHRLVDHYRLGGGVLVAKGYLDAAGVVAAVIRTYWSGFAAPVPVTVKPTPAEEDELRGRSAVAAQAVAAVLRRFRALPQPHGIAYDDGAEEAISVAVAKAALRGFIHPNETIHAAVHGGDDSDA